MVGSSDSFSWRLLLALSIIIHLILGALGYFYYDFHVVAVSVDRFVREGVSPYEWREDGIDWWFAYTPLHFLIPAPFAMLAYKFNSPIAIRLAIKAPAIIGDYLLAYAAWRKLGRRGALFVLYNPLVLYVSALRGHYDALVAGIMALAYIEALEERITGSSILTGLAGSVKQLGIIVLLPISILYRDWKQATYIFLALAIFLLISAPFIARDPTGFMDDVLWQNTAKGAWNFGYAGLVNVASGIMMMGRGKEGVNMAANHYPGFLYHLFSIPLVLGLMAYVLDLYSIIKRGNNLEADNLVWLIPLILVLSSTINIQYVIYMLVYNIIVGRISFQDRRFYLYSTIAGMVDSCEFCKSIPPTSMDPRNFWIPVLTIPNWLLGVLTLIAGLVYFIGILPYTKDVMKYLLRVYGNIEGLGINREVKK